MLLCRSIRFAVMALLTAVLLSSQPLPPADAHTYFHCGHGWSGQHWSNGGIWELGTAAVHRNLHYRVHLSWAGVVYAPDHFTSDYCAEHGGPY